LSRILTIGEFTAVVGHELGHFRGADTRFSQRFYPVYRGTSTAIASLLDTTTDGAALLPLLPAVAVLGYFLRCFSEAESEIGRERELAADACGSDVASSSDMAVALLKVHAFSPIWDGFDDAATEALEKGQAYVNASLLFASTVQRSAKPAIFEGLGGAHSSHPTDSHPPLAGRLSALGIGELGRLQDLALAVKPDRPSTELIANLEPVEQDLTAVYQALLIRTRGIDVPEEGAASQDVQTSS
jgi:Zn-dependent protease with chaperone function